MVTAAALHAGQRGHGVEVCAFQTVAELLRRRRHRSAAVQHHPDAQVLLASARLARRQNVQLRSRRQGEQMAQRPRMCTTRFIELCRQCRRRLRQFYCVKLKK